MRLLFILTLLFASTSHAAWARLLVRGNAIAAWRSDAAQVSFDGGRTFRRVVQNDGAAVALTPTTLYISDADGLRAIDARGVRAVPSPVKGVAQTLAAGPGWIVVANFENQVFRHRNGRWRRILTLEGMGFPQVDQDGRVLAQWIYDSPCGGGSGGFDGIWVPGGRMRPVSPLLAGDRLTGFDRGWLVGFCRDQRETLGDFGCLFSPTGERFELSEWGSILRVSPGAGWIAIQDSGDVAPVHVYQRQGALTLKESVPGAIVGARRDGITVLTRDRKLVRIGEKRVELPPPPKGLDHFDIDPNGRIYGLGAAGLFRLAAGRWSRLATLE